MNDETARPHARSAGPGDSISDQAAVQPDHKNDSLTRNKSTDSTSGTGWQLGILGVILSALVGLAQFSKNAPDLARGARVARKVGPELFQPELLAKLPDDLAARVKNGDPEASAEALLHAYRSEPLRFGVNKPEVPPPNRQKSVSQVDDGPPEQKNAPTQQSKESFADAVLDHLREAKRRLREDAREKQESDAQPLQLRLQEDWYAPTLEYSGDANDYLSISKTTGFTVNTISSGREVLSKTQDPDSMPDEEAGEWDRVRIRFGQDGRQFLTTSQRYDFEGRGDPYEHTVHCELSLIDGTQEDYEAGLPIKLAFSPDGLEHYRKDEEKETTLILRQFFRDALATESSLALLNFYEEPEITVRTQVQGILVTATKSSCTIIRSGPESMTADISFGLKKQVADILRGE